MNQEDINDIMWNSLPEWRKHQLRMEYDRMCAGVESYEQSERVKKLEEAMGEFVLLCEPWGELGYEPSMHSIIKTADKFKQLLEEK